MRYLSLLATAALLSISTLAGMDVNRPAPAFTIEKTDGTKVPLSQYKGKVVLMVFMSPTCPHCQQLTPALNQLQSELGPQGLQVYSVAFAEMKDYMPEYLQKYQPQYPAGLATRQQNEAFLQHSTMMRFMVPQVVLIDKQGMIRHHFDSGDAIFRNPVPGFKAEVEKLLAEGTSSTKKPVKKATSKKT